MTKFEVEVIGDTVTIRHHYFGQVNNTWHLDIAGLEKLHTACNQALTDLDQQRKDNCDHHRMSDNVPYCDKCGASEFEMHHG